MERADMQGLSQGGVRHDSGDDRGRKAKEKRNSVVEQKGERAR